MQIVHAARGHRRAGIALLLSATALLLVGCSASPEPTPRPTASASASATPEPTAPPLPVLDPAGGAAGNQAYFDFLNERLLGQNAAADGRSFIDALAAGGFDKSRMELTPDRTAVDLQADSIQFSVRFDDGCLVGQSGPATGYLSQVRAVLSTGRCLIGETRPIDW